jgi:hypothetical protein
MQTTEIQSPTSIIIAKVTKTARSKSIMTVSWLSECVHADLAYKRSDGDLEFRKSLLNVVNALRWDICVPSHGYGFEP